jgi:acyl-CoA synthetase (AMP-forming)/AMP-acid ligase II
MQKTFNLADLFEIVAEAVPERIAFICGAQQLSFRELDQRATRLGNALRDQGVQRGDNVGIQIYNSAEYLETFFACCKIGAVPANINYRYVAEELKQLFFSLDLKALVYSADFSVEVAKVSTQIPTLKLLVQVGADNSMPGAPQGAISYERLIHAGSSVADRSGRSDDDLYLLCTGGTTGLPKGVMWPHRALFVGALGGGGMYFRRGPVDRPEDLSALVLSAPPMRYFAIAPMMHGAAMWSSLISLYAGHTVVVNDARNFDAEHIWDLVQEQGIDVLSVVGDAMGQPLLQALEAHPGRWDLSQLKIFGNGGAALSEHLRSRIATLLPHLMFSNGMGSSETGVVGSGDKPATGEGFMVLTARPDLAVLDAHMQFVTAPGQHGILARTGCTPIGYYGDQKKTAETFVTVAGQLWALSGDQARIDENGNIVVLGRGSQCINTGGEKVFTEEVEEAARRYGVIADVMVVGLPDARWGQKVVAVVQLNPGQSFDIAQFQAVCRQHLSSYKVPKEVFLSEKLQRSPAGKADYRWALDFALKQLAKQS